MKFSFLNKILMLFITTLAVAYFMVLPKTPELISDYTKNKIKSYKRTIANTEAQLPLFEDYYVNTDVHIQTIELAELSKLRSMHNEYSLVLETINKFEISQNNINFEIISEVEAKFSRATKNRGTQISDIGLARELVIAQIETLNDYFSHEYSNPKELVEFFKKNLTFIEANNLLGKKMPNLTTRNNKYQNVQNLFNNTQGKTNELTESFKNAAELATQERVQFNINVRNESLTTTSIENLIKILEGNVKIDTISNFRGELFSQLEVINQNEYLKNPFSDQSKKIEAARSAKNKFIYNVILLLESLSNIHGVEFIESKIFEQAFNNEKTQNKPSDLIIEEIVLEKLTEIKQKNQNLTELIIELRKIEYKLLSNKPAIAKVQKNLLDFPAEQTTNIRTSKIPKASSNLVNTETVDISKELLESAKGDISRYLEKAPLSTTEQSLKILNEYLNISHSENPNINKNVNEFISELSNKNIIPENINSIEAYKKIIEFINISQSLHGVNTITLFEKNFIQNFVDNLPTNADGSLRDPKQDLNQKFSQEIHDKLINELTSQKNSKIRNQLISSLQTIAAENPNIKDLLGSSNDVLLETKTRSTETQLEGTKGETPLAKNNNNKNNLIAEEGVIKFNNEKASIVSEKIITDLKLMGKEITLEAFSEMQYNNKSYNDFISELEILSNKNLEFRSKRLRLQNTTLTPNNTNFNLVEIRNSYLLELEQLSSSKDIAFGTKENLRGTLYTQKNANVTDMTARQLNSSITTIHNAIERVYSQNSKNKKLRADIARDVNLKYETYTKGLTQILFEFGNLSASPVVEKFDIRKIRDTSIKVEVFRNGQKEIVEYKTDFKNEINGSQLIKDLKHGAVDLSLVSTTFLAFLYGAAYYKTVTDYNSNPIAIEDFIHTYLNPLYYLSFFAFGAGMHGTNRLFQNKLAPQYLRIMKYMVDNDFLKMNPTKYQSIFKSLMERTIFGMGFSSLAVGFGASIGVYFYGGKAQACLDLFLDKPMSRNGAKERALKEQQCDQTFVEFAKERWPQLSREFLYLYGTNLFLMLVGKKVSQLQWGNQIKFFANNMMYEKIDPKQIPKSFQNPTKKFKFLLRLRGITIQTAAFVIVYEFVHGIVERNIPTVKEKINIGLAKRDLNSGLNKFLPDMEITEYCFSSAQPWKHFNRHKTDYKSIPYFTLSTKYPDCPNNGDIIDSLETYFLAKDQQRETIIGPYNAKLAIWADYLEYAFHMESASKHFYKDILSQINLAKTNTKDRTNPDFKLSFLNIYQDKYPDGLDKHYKDIYQNYNTSFESYSENLIEQNLDHPLPFLRSAFHGTYPEVTEVPLLPYLYEEQILYEIDLEKALLNQTENKYSKSEISDFYNYLKSDSNTQIPYHLSRPDFITTNNLPKGKFISKASSLDETTNEEAVQTKEEILTDFFLEAEQILLEATTEETKETIAEPNIETVAEEPEEPLAEKPTKKEYYRYTDYISLFLPNNVSLYLTPGLISEKYPHDPVLAPLFLANVTYEEVKPFIPMQQIDDLNFSFSLDNQFYLEPNKQILKSALENRIGPAPSGFSFYESIELFPGNIQHQQNNNIFSKKIEHLKKSSQIILNWLKDRAPETSRANKQLFETLQLTFRNILNLTNNFDLTNPKNLKNNTLYSALVQLNHVLQQNITDEEACILVPENLNCLMKPILFLLQSPYLEIYDRLYQRRLLGLFPQTIDFDNYRRNLPLNESDSNKDKQNNAELFNTYSLQLDDLIQKYDYRNPYLWISNIDTANETLRKASEEVLNRDLKGCSNENLGNPFCIYRYALILIESFEMHTPFKYRKRPDYGPYFYDNKHNTYNNSIGPMNLAPRMLTPGTKYLLDYHKTFKEIGIDVDWYPASFPQRSIRINSLTHFLTLSTICGPKTFEGSNLIFSDKLGFSPTMSPPRLVFSEEGDQACDYVTQHPWNLYTKIETHKRTYAGIADFLYYNTDEYWYSDTQQDLFLNFWDKNVFSPGNGSEDAPLDRIIQERSNRINDIVAEDKPKLLFGKAGWNISEVISDLPESVSKIFSGNMKWKSFGEKINVVQSIEDELNFLFDILEDIYDNPNLNFIARVPLPDNLFRLQTVLRDEISETDETYFGEGNTKTTYIKNLRSEIMNYFYNLTAYAQNFNSDIPRREISKIKEPLIKLFYFFYAVDDELINSYFETENESDFKLIPIMSIKGLPDQAFKESCEDTKCTDDVVHLNRFLLNRIEKLIFVNLANILNIRPLAEEREEETFFEVNEDDNNFRGINAELLEQLAQVKQEQETKQKQQDFLKLQRQESERNTTIY